MFGSKLCFSWILETLGCILMVFTHSGITPPKVNRFGWNLDRCECVVGGWLWQIFARDLHSSESRTARRNFIFFLSGKWNTRFYPFPVGQISQNSHTARWWVWRWKRSEQNFENFALRVIFSKQMQKFLTFTRSCNFRPPRTPQWLQIDKNSLANDPSTGCLVYIFIIGINSSVGLLNPMKRACDWQASMWLAELTLGAFNGLDEQSS